MPTLVVPNALQVTCKGSFLGQPWANVYGLAVDNTFLMAPAVADEIAAEFSAFYDAINSLLGLSWRFNEVYINDLRAATDPSYEPVVAELAGLNVANPLAPNMAVCASHTTGFSGKSYRGRTYLTGWTEDWNDANGQIAATVRSGVAGEFDNLRAGLENNVTNGCQLAVISRKLLVATPITGTSVDAEWDHQDRRKRS